MAEQFMNLAQTSLSGSVGSGDATIPVLSIAGFPVSAQYRVRIDNEIMIVTGGVGSTTWSVTRGVEGTAAAAHVNGSAVIHVLTAGAIGGQSDPAVGVPGLRTLGSGAQQAMPGNRTLDAVPKAAASVDVNTNKILNVVDPVGAQDAATKNYVDTHTGSGAPSGPASGDLAGTYPAPTVKDSVGLTGTPTAPTAAADTSTTQIASTAFVIGQQGTSTPLVDGSAAAGSSSKWTPIDHVHPTDTSRMSVSPSNVSISNASTSAAVQVTQTGNASASTSVGGAINLSNSANTGAGLVVYSSNASPAGRLIVARADNPTFSVSATYTENAGTGHALHANQTTASPNSTGSAANLTSSNSGASCVQVSGIESGRGSVKVTHTNPGSGAAADANASALSIDLQKGSETGTAAQGIFIDATTGGTTGPLIQVRNNGNNIFKVASDAAFSTPIISFGGLRVTTGTVAPTTGTWNQGDQLLNTAPAAGGNLGWVCVTGGTPGTWKKFGAIEV